MFRSWTAVKLKHTGNTHDTHHVELIGVLLIAERLRQEVAGVLWTTWIMSNPTCFPAQLQFESEHCTTAALEAPHTSPLLHDSSTTTSRSASYSDGARSVALKNRFSSLDLPHSPPQSSGLTLLARMISLMFAAMSVTISLVSLTLTSTLLVS